MPLKKKEFPKNIRIIKLYADGYKGLKDFEIDFSDSSCWLLAGKNGSGKTRVGEILEIFHKIGAGESEWIGLRKIIDFESFQSGTHVKIVGEIAQSQFSYEVQERRNIIEKEEIIYQNKIILERDKQIIKIRGKKISGIKIPEDRLSLPMVGSGEEFDKILDFLKRISILRLHPSHMSLFQKIKDKFDYAQGTPPVNLWHEFLMKENFSWSKKIENESISLAEIKEREDIRFTSFMQKIWPDLIQISSLEIHENYSLHFKFRDLKQSLSLHSLSDGERIFFMTALLMAELETLGPRICYWDEPENFLAPSEITSQLLSLQSAFQKSGGQFIASSHNPLAMKNFSADEMIYLKRDSHDASPKAIPVTKMGYEYGDDFRDAYIHDRLNDES